MFFSPATLAIEDRYKLLIGSVVPRPIALVSTISRDGKPNLAPFSFFSGISANPLLLLFCPANKPDGSEKDSLRNAAPLNEGGTGEFVVNIVSEAMARQMAACAEPLPHGESEWDLSGLTPETWAQSQTHSQAILPSRVAQSPVSFACRTSRVLRLNPGQHSGGNIVIGEVVSIFVREGIANERLHIDPAILDAIGRMGGLSYCTTRDRFEVPMGSKALKQ